MQALVEAVIAALVATFRPRASLLAENLALGQEVATLLREGRRPRLGRDEVFETTAQDPTDQHPSKT